MRRLDGLRMFLSPVAQLAAVALILFPIPRCAADDLFAPPQDDLLFEAVGDRFSTSAVEDRGAATPLDDELPSELQESRSVGHGSNERLIDRTTDPTAWLMDLRLRQEWNWPVEASGSDSQTLQLRPTIPFMAWDKVNLLRIAVNYGLEDAGGSGLEDVQMFHLVVSEESWGRWGVGPSVRLNPDSGSAGDTLLAGPAGGAVTKNRHWTIGVLTQNFLGDTDSETRLQPILAYKFDDRWAVSAGESEFRYDWNDSTWSQIPLGGQVEYIADVCGQKVQIFVNPQYNFQRDASNSGWTIFVGLTLLVPDA
jgi:hypothetical protein